jgi:hypothetical protein
MKANESFFNFVDQNLSFISVPSFKNDDRLPGEIEDKLNYIGILKYN